MRVGVIGGSGFIGSHVVDKLIEHGHEVVVFDMMRPHRKDVPHIFVDVTDFSKMVVALAGEYDALYMLAAMANVNDVYNSPVEATMVNVAAVANALEAARRTRAKCLILASTVWIYEMAQGREVDEDSPLNIGKVKHIYTASKLAAELLCHSYQKLYGQPFTILRYGIPYGPRARDGLVTAIFVRKALRGEALTIYGDGSQYRNFLYVEDLAEGNAAALQDVGGNQIYNLVGRRPITIREVAETVARLIGDVRIEYQAGRSGDYKGKIVSGLKAERELGWKPKVEFEEGMRRYIEWYRKFGR